MGVSVKGLWTGSQACLHTNVLELLTMYLTLKHLLLRLTGCHVLAQMDNTAEAAYINYQGGLRSAQMSRLAHRLII